MNIKFNYMYRDGANYKQFGSVIFANPSNLTLEIIETKIRETLIDGEFFEPLKLDIPNVRVYPYDPEIDHDWFEFENVEQTDKSPTDKRTIAEFIAELKGELQL
ncbi:MAG: hypothetical protein AB7G44_12685 [Bacteroidia bacterium]